MIDPWFGFNAKMFLGPGKILQIEGIFQSEWCKVILWLLLSSTYMSKPNLKIRNIWEGVLSCCPYYCWTNLPGIIKRNVKNIKLLLGLVSYVSSPSLLQLVSFSLMPLKIQLLTIVGRWLSGQREGLEKRGRPWNPFQKKRPSLFNSTPGPSPIKSFVGHVGAS